MSQMPIKDIYLKLIQSMPNARMRSSQWEMIESINSQVDKVANQHTEYDKLESDDEFVNDGTNIAIIEAPTGTGKSLAYLLSLVYSAQKLQKKVVISTATKTLQAQLLNIDIPRFIKNSGVVFSYAIAKGRSNYLCPYQLELSISETDLTNQDQADTLEKIKFFFDKGRFNGDLDNLPIPANAKLRDKLVIEHHQCLNTSCPFNQKDDIRCPYYANKAKFKTVDVIVTNHSLLMLDMVNGNSLLNNQPEDYLLCIDEAHNLINAAKSSCASDFMLKESAGFMRNLSNYVLDAVKPEDWVIMRENANKLSLKLIELDLVFNNNQNQFVDNIFLLNDYIVASAKELNSIFVDLNFLSNEILLVLSKQLDKLKEDIKKQANAAIVLESHIGKLGFYQSELDRIIATTELILNHDDSKFNANAKFVEILKTGTNSDYKICGQMTYIGSRLTNLLWKRSYFTVLTSATLAIRDSFDYFRFEIGLNLLPNVYSHKLPTNFDYTAQAQLYLPGFKSSPEFITRHEYLKELTLFLNLYLCNITRHGVLVLFFSRQQMLDCYANLKTEIKNKILLQTDYMSNQKLLEDHIKIVDAGRSSIIFGLNSFAEGVDLPGHYCLQVIITKLPFSTHKDPESQVKEYWVKAEHGNYFIEYSLPEVIIRLIQATGRLIRNEEDFGQITICDNRIFTKQYGKTIINALPSYNQNYNPNFINMKLSDNGEN